MRNSLHYLGPVVLGYSIDNTPLPQSHRVSLGENYKTMQDLLVLI